MNKKIDISIAEMRVSVALLGEVKGWWNTLFFNSNSDAFLDYIFPRSKKTNQIIACDVAQKIIDQKVGANNYHLFRLSINHEEQIHTLLKNGEVNINFEDDAFTVLEKISNGLSINPVQGPKNIGSLDELDTATIQAFAAEYLSAFKNDYQVHPYLK